MPLEVRPMQEQVSYCEHGFRDQVPPIGNEYQLSLQQQASEDLKDLLKVKLLEQSRACKHSQLLCHISIVGYEVVGFKQISADL